ncbi:hypothetical protein [Pseudarthrobacter sp. 1C304]|uniref:hypothetical protein n=1 Tax=Pseudarthrobacter sp. 1C304 TaxID=3457438 RepID=UPI003FD0C0F5
MEFSAFFLGEERTAMESAIFPLGARPDEARKSARPEPATAVAPSDLAAAYPENQDLDNPSAYLTSIRTKSVKLNEIFSRN